MIAMVAQTCWGAGSTVSIVVSGQGRFASSTAAPLGNRYRHDVERAARVLPWVGHAEVHVKRLDSCESAADQTAGRCRRRSQAWMLQAPAAIMMDTARASHAGGNAAGQASSL